MPLHPLNENQIAFLEEYRSSGMSVLEFARSKGVQKSAVYYLIGKERRLKGESFASEVIKANNFVSVPIETNELSIKSLSNNTNNIISFNLNGLSISISKENLKAFLEVISQ